MRGSQLHTLHPYVLSLENEGAGRGLVSALGWDLGTGCSDSEACPGATWSGS